MKYTSTHVPSGRTYPGQFNASHHHVFADPDGYGLRTRLKAAEALIAKWNRQQPDTWHYKLVKETQDASQD